MLFLPVRQEMQENCLLVFLPARKQGRSGSLYFCSIYDHLGRFLMSLLSYKFTECQFTIIIADMKNEVEEDR